MKHTLEETRADARAWNQLNARLDVLLDDLAAGRTWTELAFAVRSPSYTVPELIGMVDLLKERHKQSVEASAEPVPPPAPPAEPGQ